MTTVSASARVTPSVHEVLTVPAQARSASGGPHGHAAPERSDQPSAFEKVLRGVGREVSGGESLMRAAMTAGGAGRTLDPGEIIALQAGVYRYGETVDLASRLVDRATGSVKTVLQGQ
ncbi:MAG: hypothetical protein ACREJ3_07880 [Polyangiaceae bacterium]